MRSVFMRYHNPTLIDMWIDVDGKVFCIKSGETVELE